MKSKARKDQFSSHHRDVSVRPSKPGTFQCLFQKQVGLALLGPTSTSGSGVSPVAAGLGWSGGVGGSHQPRLRCA